MRTLKFLFVGLVLLAIGAGSAHSVPICSISSLQALVDKAEPGSTVTLTAGICSVNLVINKSLTLRGANFEKTVLKGSQPGKPVLYIESESPIKVMVENLSLVDAPKFSAERDCAIFYPELICPSGFEVRGKAHATLRHARIAGNAWVGVYVLDASRAIVQDAEILNNGWGVYLSGEAQISVEDSRVLNNKQVGIEAWASVSVTNSKISGNVDGIKIVQGSAKIFNNEIRENSGHGLLATSTVSTEIRGNQITQNVGWGITAWLRRCGFSNDSFSGQVTAIENKVEENKQGQVCLP
ncbi:right-handed parallel beta-helix repeat-containing protein [Candidatus Acetothermia bacterium]|nr:right-handed parallel beta-helix repeat-containing protein [Candidatus Acetothermia bacterium]